MIADALCSGSESFCAYTETTSSVAKKAAATAASFVFMADLVFGLNKRDL